MFNKTFSVFGLLLAAILVCAPPADAQLVTLTSTTTSAAMAANVTEICLTSGTGVNVPGVGTLGSTLFVGGTEQMTVQSAGSATGCYNVRRTKRPMGHASGETVYIGTANNFRNYDQGGTCVLADMEVRPWINVANGNIWDCVSSKYQVINGPAAYAVGLTAIGPATAGNIPLGSALLPFQKLYFGTAATNNIILTPAATAAARTVTLDDPLGNDAIAYLAATQTFTNKTLTSPAITTDIRATTAGAPSIGTALKPFGSLILGTAATNAFTFTPAALGAARAITIADPGGAATLAWSNPTSQQTLTNTTLSGTGIIQSDTGRASAQLDCNSGGTGNTLTNINGMSVTVAPGTYRFKVYLPGTSTANGGVKVAFKYTATVVTTIDATAKLFTASGVAVQHMTNNADQASLAALTAAATIDTEIEGTMVVGTGGTIQVQGAQNAAHVDTTSFYVGSYVQFTRIS